MREYREIQAMYAGERRGRDERTQADRQLDEAEQAQGMPNAVSQPARSKAAERKAAHEAGEDRAGGVCRDAERQREQSQPEHLVDQRADTRQDQEADER